jgi:hypothetical protein
MEGPITGRLTAEPVLIHCALMTLACRRDTKKDLALRETILKETTFIVRTEKSREVIHKKVDRVSRPYYVLRFKAIM